jgi:hypothetical protein
MRYIGPDENLPPWCAEALALLLDLPEDQVLAAWLQTRREEGYRWLRLRGARGRIVHVPTPLLAEVQRRVLDRVLLAGSVSPAAYAGVPGRSPVRAARLHLRERGAILRLDIRDAYASTRYGTVTGALRRRIRRDAWVLGLDREERGVLVGALGYLLTIRRAAGPGRHLPLGAPSSLATFNLVCLGLDREIATLLDAFFPTRGGRYTRYVDDLVISHPEKFSHRSLVADLGSLVSKRGFQLNPAKTRYGSVKEIDVHGIVRTRRGLEPSPAATRRLEATLRSHEAVVSDPSRSEEERGHSRAVLRGVHAYVGQFFEREGRGRPGDLVPGVDVGRDEPGIEDHEELWR